MSELDFQNFNYYDYFDTSEADEIIAEASNKLMNHLKTEVSNKLEQVIKENEELKRENNKLKNDLYEKQSKINEYYSRERTLEQDFMQKKWSELSDKLTMTVWGINYKSVLKKKCNCCDENRKIRFTDANNNEYEVNCKCNQSVTIAEPKEKKLLKMYIHKNRYKNLGASCYYYDIESNNDDYVCVRENESPLGHLPDNEEELSKLDTWRLAFATEELAQRYCNWRNRYIMDIIETEECNIKERKRKAIN